MAEEVGEIKPNELVQQFYQIFKGDLRKEQSYERWLVYEEAFPELISKRIHDTHDDPETIAHMKQWVDVSNNLALDILGQIAVVYKNGVERTVRDVSEARNIDLRKLYADLEIDSLTPEWNAQGYYMNELLAMPQVVGGEPVIRTALPHMYEPITDPVTGKDTAYIYTTNCKIHGPKHALHEDAAVGLSPGRVDCDFVLLDDMSWRTFDGRTGRMIEQTFHGLGYVPAVRLSYHKGFGGHRWASHKRGQRLHDATLAAALVSTTMGFVRKAQNRKLLVAIGETDMAEGDDPPVNDTEKGVHIPSHPNSVTLQSIDFDTDPRHFINQIVWIYQSVAQGYGGFVELAGAAAGTGSPSLRVGFPYETQTEIRDRQLPATKIFERSLGATLVDVMRVAGHPDGAKMPDPKAIRAGMGMDFGKLSRRFANPTEEQAHYDFLKSNGLTHQGEMLKRQEGSNMTDEECKRIIDGNLEFQAWFNDLATKRNLPLTSGQEVTDAASLNGAQGAQKREENKTQPQESADTD